MKYTHTKFRIARKLKLGLSLSLSVACSACFHENEQYFGKLGTPSAPPTATADPASTSVSDSSLTSESDPLSASVSVNPNSGNSNSGDSNLGADSDISTSSNSGTQDSATSSSYPEGNHVSGDESGDDDATSSTSSDSSTDVATASVDLYNSLPDQESAVPGFLAESGEPVLDPSGNTYFENIMVGIESNNVVLGGAQKIMVQFAALIEEGTRVYSKTGDQLEALIHNDGSFPSKFRCAMKPIEISADQVLPVLVNDQISHKKVLLKWRVWKVNDPSFDPTSSLCGHSEEALELELSDCDSDEEWSKRGWTVVHEKMDHI